MASSSGLSPCQQRSSASSFCRRTLSEGMLTEVLPSEILSLVLAQLCLVRNIRKTKRTCRAFRDAAGPVEQAFVASVANTSTSVR